MLVKWYGLGMLAIVKQDVDLETATVKMSLHTSSYTPNQDTHDFANDLTNELSGSGYAAQTLAGVTYSYDTASQQVRLDFTDPTFAFNASSTWRYGVLWVDTAGASSTDPLIAYIDWESNQTSSVSHTLTVAAAGLLYIDVT